MRVMSSKYEMRIKCIDFERMKYLQSGKVPTMDTYDMIPLNEWEMKRFGGLPKFWDFW